MSVRPLDLQVNINSLNEVSRVEGEKLAHDASLKRHTDEKIIKDNILRESRVEQVGETEIKSNVKEHAEHFGNLTGEEIDAYELSHRQRHSEQQPQEQATSNSETEEKPTESNIQHHIDILA